MLLALVVSLVACQDPVAPPPSWLEVYLQGHRALEVGDLDRAARELERALQLNPDHGATAWALGCVEARRGQADVAFDWLEKSVDWGGGELPLLQWDPDLDALRELPRFGELKNRLIAKPGVNLLEPEPHDLQIDSSCS